MKCAQCGTENKDTSPRCSVCGDLLPEPGQPEAVSLASLGGPSRQKKPTDEEVIDALSRRKKRSYEYLYDQTHQIHVESEPPGEYLTPTTPGLKSVAERPIYLNQPSAQPERRAGSLYFNPRILPFLIPFILAGTLFIVATYSPWMKASDGVTVTGWDLYHKGQDGTNGGNAFFIPDVLNVNNEFSGRSGMLLTGLWTLTGGILLFALSLALLLVYQPRFLYMVLAVGVVLLIITGINLVTMVLSKATLLWPIYAMPAATVVVMLISMDARRAY